MHPTRRHFFFTTAGAATAQRTVSTAARSAVISRITLVEVPGDFVRPVAMNAYDKRVKGKDATIRLARVFLDDGTVGLGVEGYVPIRESGLAFLKSMIGVAPESVYRWENDRIAGFALPFASRMDDPANGWFEGPLLDAIGKIRSKPAYMLFASSVRSGIDAYDGSLYFVDVASGRGAEAVGEVAKAISADGFRAVKVKVGRPFQWMQGERGVVRDIEAVIAVREAVGWNFNVMVDANNGYEGHFDWAVRFLKECAPYELYWIEEIFPESVEQYRKLHRALLEINGSTPVADGESVKVMEEFTPFLKAGAYRYIQPDMRTCGMSKILRAADLAGGYGVKVVPHNWASEMGKVMSMHAAKIRRNIPFVEDDRFHNFALDASAHQFKQGQWFVTDRPGWGVELSPNYDRFAKIGREIVIT